MMEDGDRSSKPWYLFIAQVHDLNPCDGDLQAIGEFGAEKVRDTELLEMEYSGYTCFEVRQRLVRG